MSTLELIHDEQPQDLKQERDWAIWLIVGVTLTLSVAAFVYFSSQGVLFGHRDSISHLMIARRAVAGDSPHLLLLGSVWLPLQHLLMLPFIWITPLYYSGVAGALAGGIAYVVMAVFIYKILLGLTSHRIAALTGVAVFAFNPNILYLQTTAMMEPAFFATTVVAIYYLQQWIQSERHGYLVTSAVAVLLSTLTRYEAWVMATIFVVIVACVCVRKKIQSTPSIVFTFAAISFAGPTSWLAYNALFFGSPFYFRTGEYGDPKLWESSADPSIGNWTNAFMTYWYAVRDDLNIIVIALAIIGIACLIARRNMDVLPVLATVVLFPFFVYSIESAQSPLRVMQVAGSMFNLRYGLVMLLPAAIAIGYLIAVISKASSVKLVWPAVVVAAVIVPFVPKGIDGLVTYAEAKAGIEASQESIQYQASQFLSRYYDGGLLLAESSNNESVLFDGRIPLEDNVYEGTYQVWDKALENPSENSIRWIVMRSALDTTVERVSPDKVYSALHDSPELASYELVFQDASYSIYKER